MYITKEQLNNIIYLHHQYSSARDLYQQKYYPTGEIIAGSYFDHKVTPENLAIESARRELEDYMNELDYNAILDLEALMKCGKELSPYGGIDKLKTKIYEDYKYYEGHIELKLLFPEKRFKFYRDEYAHSYPTSEGQYEAVAYIRANSFLHSDLYYAMDALNI